MILTFGGGEPQTVPGMGGFKIALDALEALRRQWAVELGPHGIRVVTIKTGGIPETLPKHFRAATRPSRAFSTLPCFPGPQPSMTLVPSRRSWPQTRLGRSLRPMSTSPRAPSSTKPNESSVMKRLDGCLRGRLASTLDSPRPECVFCQLAN